MDFSQVSLPWKSEDHFHQSREVHKSQPRTQIISVVLSGAQWLCEQSGETAAGCIGAVQPHSAAFPGSLDTRTSCTVQ